MDLNTLHSVTSEDVVHQQDLEIWGVPEWVEQCSVFIGIHIDGAPPATPIGAGDGVHRGQHPMRMLFSL